MYPAEQFFLFKQGGVGGKEGDVSLASSRFYWVWSFYSSHAHSSPSWPSLTLALLTCYPVKSKVPESPLSFLLAMGKILNSFIVIPSPIVWE